MPPTRCGRTAYVVDEGAAGQRTVRVSPGEADGAYDLDPLYVAFTVWLPRPSTGALRTARP